MVKSVTPADVVWTYSGCVRCSMTATTILWGK